MVLVPWRCYEGLSCFAQQMNQLFDRFFERELIDRPWEKVSYPRLNMVDSEDEVVVELDIPGFSPEELEITFKEGVLVIKGKKEKDKEVKTREVHYIQKETGSFIRTVPVQQNIQAEAITAKFKNSKLTITLPKIKKKHSLFKVRIK